MLSILYIYNMNSSLSFSMKHKKQPPPPPRRLILASPKSPQVKPHQIGCSSTADTTSTTMIQPVIIYEDIFHETILRLVNHNDKQDKYDA